MHFVNPLISGAYNEKRDANDSSGH